MFIQAFMWKKFFSSDEVRQLHKECHAKNKVPRTDLKNFVDRINSAISPMNMAIKKGTDEISGEDYYVLINADDNQISRLSSEYKPKELELFKKIINSIVLSDEGKVKSIDALNLADEINVSKKDGEEIVNKFCEDGWLLKDDGCIIFATRAIVELQHFLRKEFKDDITLCTLCQNIVFQ
ncbi:Non-structural maintenance of chromosomes element 1-like protein, partial [Stegodyphus mimosarum]